MQMRIGALLVQLQVRRGAHGDPPHTRPLAPDAQRDELRHGAARHEHRRGFAQHRGDLALERVDQFALAVAVGLPAMFLAPLPDACQLGARRGCSVTQYVNRTASAQDLPLRRNERSRNHLPPRGVSLVASMRSLFVCNSYALMIFCTSGWRTTSALVNAVNAIPRTSARTRRASIKPLFCPRARSIWVTSPVMTDLVPNPIRVRNIFICSGVVFCASSRMMNEWLSVRPRMNASGASSIAPRSKARFTLS